eukprot:6091473-Amphidinium_carterae.1
MADQKHLITQKLVVCDPQPQLSWQLEAKQPPTSAQSNCYNLANAPSSTSPKLAPDTSQSPPR